MIQTKKKNACPGVEKSKEQLLGAFIFHQGKCIVTANTPLSVHSYSDSSTTCWDFMMFQKVLTKK